MNGRLFMEAMGDIKDDFIMEASDIDEIKRCFAEWDDEEDDVTTEPEKTGHKKIKRIPRIRKLLIAAVISVSLLLAANFAAMALGYDSLAILREFGDRIIEMFEGEKTEYRGIDIYKGNKKMVYLTINDFFENTDYIVLYPSKLPNMINITKVGLYDSFNLDGSISANYKSIYYTTNEKEKFIIIVDTNPNSDLYHLINQGASIENINKFKCYMFFYDTTVQCCFVHNNYIYTISAPNYDDIVTIVSNMKEYEE